MKKHWPYYYPPYIQAKQPIMKGPHLQNYANSSPYSYYHHGAPMTTQKNNDEEKTEKPKVKKVKPDLVDSIQSILEKLEKLEEENQQLKEEIENIKPITIENINYKIQDLSVQELSGTLLVGLTALSEAEELQKLLQENGPVTLNGMDTAEMEQAMENEEAFNENNNDNMNNS